MKQVRGFSLIEVLLTVTLLAGGLALAFATMRNATQASERAEVTARYQERLRAVQAFVRRQLDGAMPLPMDVVDAGGDPVLFAASADEVAFVAPMPGYLSRGGPYVQHLRLVRGGGNGGLRLEFTFQLLTPDGPLDPEREPQVLLDGIADGRFEVRSLDENGEPGDWGTGWDKPGAMPRLVRLQLRMQDERRAWPMLVAAPRLGQNAPALAIDSDAAATPEETE